MTEAYSTTLYVYILNFPKNLKKKISYLIKISDSVLAFSDFSVPKKNFLTTPNSPKPNSDRFTLNKLNQSHWLQPDADLDIHHLLNLTNLTNEQSTVIIVKHYVFSVSLAVHSRMIIPWLLPKPFLTSSGPKPTTF